MRALSRTWRYTSRVAVTMTIAMLIGTIGCAARQPIVEQRDDVSITNDVQARLAADAKASPFKIGVETKAGVVHLRGFVATDDQRNSVERIARDTPGVRAVDNNIIFGGVPVRVEPLGG